MKKTFTKHIFALILISLTFISCEGDDDVCLSGEATPRMKVKFKSTDNKLMTLDSIYLDVNYGGNVLVNVATLAKADSVLVPLRVDQTPFTEFYIRRQKKGPIAKVKISYNTKSQYVSPACGFKILYENTSGVLETPNPVTKLELNQNQIINEDKTHLYLIF